MIANPLLMVSCPRSGLRIWPCETGSAVLSRVSLLISILRLNLVLTYGIPPAFRDRVQLYRQPTSGHSRVYRVTQLRTNGVHCRESAGTGPVVLKVVLVTGASFSGITMDIDQSMCGSLPPPPYIDIVYVCMYVKVSKLSRAEFGSTEYSGQSCSWSAEQGNTFFSPSPFALKNLVSRDRFGRASARQPACLFSALGVNLVGDVQYKKYRMRFLCEPEYKQESS